MRIFRVTSWHGRVRGVTLVEMLVAVSITVMMLMVTGIVFKSSSEASGKAAALNEMMRQVRAITSQLESDLAGLRSDMPMAIIFEAHQNNVSDPTYIPGDPTTWRGDPDEPLKLVHYDRIVFFANGDFQTIDGGGSGNMARIFYGQAADMLTMDTIDPPRKILTRRRKIMTADTVWLPVPAMFASPQEYDNIDMECASVAFWKNELFPIFYNSYFNENQIVSFVRRPNLHATSDKAKQKMYMLPDVTDFKIQVWGWDYINNKWRWFPEPHILYSSGTLANLAFYWNAPANPVIPPMTPFKLNVSGIDIDWWSDTAMTFPGIPDPWPEAIKFTFTLYDKDRRHFPEGKTFTYIMKMPKKI